MYDRERIHRPHVVDPAGNAFAATSGSHATNDPIGATFTGHNFGQIAVVSPVSSAPALGLAGLAETYPRAQRFAVSIPRLHAPSKQHEPTMGSTTSRPYAHSADAGVGGEDQHMDLNAQMRRPPSTDLDVMPPEPAEGETITIPDIVIPMSFAMTDTINGNKLLFETLTTLEGEPGKNDFGLTTAYAPTISDISITNESSAYTVRGVLQSEIKMSVRTVFGPDGQTDLPYALLTQASYPVIVSDLTPNMSDLNGRPPRTKFWSREITVKHERFHATEYEHFSEMGATQAIAWLNSQTTSSAGGVKALLRQIPNKVISTVIANMAAPASEQRAYGDGAASYTALANSIKAKGDAKGYPPDPGGIGLIWPF
ncbi:MAG TPA: hypothetical protein VH591_08950 [Ktedonobacterales bacterium]|jgi:hypothetical protein